MDRDPYARLAPLYDLLVTPLERPIFKRITAEAGRQGVRKMVDLGCGTGVLCAMLHDAGIEATGVDVSSSMLARAAKSAPPGVTLHLEDATDTHFGPAAFDGASINFALHENKQEKVLALLAEARRILTPDGLLLATDYLAPRTLAARAALLAAHPVERAAGRDHYAGFRRFLAAGGLEGVLAKAGFGVKAVRPLFFGAVGLAGAHP